VNYLLDTNACIALINGKPPSVRAKFQKATDAGAQVFVSCVALFGLWVRGCKEFTSRIQSKVSEPR